MKKILAMLLCATLAVSMLVGCSSSDADTAEDADAAAEESTDDAEAEEATDDAAAEDATASTSFDFSSVEVQMDDPSFPNGAVYYSDIRDIIGATPVPDREISIGFIMKSLENEYWRDMYDGIMEEVERLEAEGFNVTVDIRAGQTETDQEGQLAIMNDMINKQYDCIVAAPISDSNLVPAIESAQDAGIPVVSLSVAYDNDPYVPYYVGLSSYFSGQSIAQYFSEQLGEEGGEVAIIMGIANNPSARDRTLGFQDWVEAHPEANLTIVDTQNADWDRAKAKDVTDTLLMANPDLKAIFCNNDTMAMGSIESVKAAGKIGEVLVAGTDGVAEALESIKAGELSATSNQYSYYLGKVALDVAFRAIDGQDLPDRIWSPNGVVSAENVDADPAEVIGWVDLQYEKK